MKYVVCRARVKTVDHHIQNGYRKIGVSTRAAATLFAMEHGLVAWENSRLPGQRTAPRVHARSATPRPRR